MRHTHNIGRVVLLSGNTSCQCGRRPENLPSRGHVHEVSAPSVGPFGSLSGNSLWPTVRKPHPGKHPRIKRANLFSADIAPERTSKLPPVHVRVGRSVQGMSRALTWTMLRPTGQVYSHNRALVKSTCSYRCRPVHGHFDPTMGAAAAFNASGGRCCESAGKGAMSHPWDS